MSTKPRPSMNEDDWKAIEAQIDSACNAEYKVVRKQLVVVAKIDLQESVNSEEIFTNYGSMRNQVALVVKYLALSDFSLTLPIVTGPQRNVPPGEANENFSVKHFMQF